MNKTLIASALIGLFASNAAFANQETDELRKVIADQQKVLESLERRLDETDQKLNATADQIEVGAEQSAFSNTSIGGYGELHYNNYEDKDAEVDFHRFVLFFGHEFSDSVRFFSEFELEHSIAGEGKPGEVELEQAYVEVDINEGVSSKVGLFLIPVGIINETHEPPTFYGVERNGVEKNIIPATWWEAGVAFNYKPAGGVSIDGAVTSGLNSTKKNFDSNGDFTHYSFTGIRKGRQKVAKATAENLAYTGRVKYTAITGLELAATLQYQTDLTQGLGELDTASATLFETHAIYQVQDFTVRALYARWDIDGDEAKASGSDEQTGWYVEPSYKFNEKVGVFARYSEYDNNAGNSASTAVESTSVGVNYYIHENVVLKADYENLGGASDSSGFNLGFGYQF
ncbi:porin [Candidatus Colwellia aromaticivorans]|uniref:porin n=1 Tax=Candidatus Colwellia aromaticivorans TaxID=2267621 RepID=UPI000DF430EF|nr:porin [Candidatus Colwellia aromaticivorans]